MTIPVWFCTLKNTQPTKGDRSGTIKKDQRSSGKGGIESSAGWPHKPSVEDRRRERAVTTRSETSRQVSDEANNSCPYQNSDAREDSDAPLLRLRIRGSAGGIHLGLFSYRGALSPVREVPSALNSIALPIPSGASRKWLACERDERQRVSDS